MEEILASIRRIISEDEAPAETAAEATEAPVAEPEAAAEAETVAAESPVETPPAEAPHADDDVLELTDRYEATATIGDLDVLEPTPEPTPVPSVEAASTSAPAPSYDSLVGDSAAASAASAFAGLAASFKKPEPAPSAPTHDLPFVSGNTVEAMVAEMLRPLLKDWLDANLPGIVQAAVQKEVERIARSA